MITLLKPLSAIDHYNNWRDGLVTANEAIHAMKAIGSKGAFTLVKQVERLVWEYRKR